MDVDRSMSFATSDVYVYLIFLTALQIRRGKFDVNISRSFSSSGLVSRLPCRASDLRSLDRGVSALHPLLFYANLNT